MLLVWRWETIIMSWSYGYESREEQRRVFFTLCANSSGVIRCFSHSVCKCTHVSENMCECTYVCLWLNASIRTCSETCASVRTSPGILVNVCTCPVIRVSVGTYPRICVSLRTCPWLCANVRACPGICVIARIICVILRTLSDIMCTYLPDTSSCPGTAPFPTLVLCFHWSRFCSAVKRRGCMTNPPMWQRPLSHASKRSSSAWHHAVSISEMRRDFPRKEGCVPLRSFLIFSYLRDFVSDSLLEITALNEAWCSRNMFTARRFLSLDRRYRIFFMNGIFQESPSSTKMISFFSKNSKSN